MISRLYRSFGASSGSGAKRPYTKIFIICILIIILILFSYLCYRNHKETIENININEKVSIYILSYKRPHNLDISLPLLNNMKWVDEIIVSHGSPEHYKEFNFPKVKNIKDFENNNKYGAGRRFLLNLDNFKNNLILTLDDDHIPSDHLLKRLIREGGKDPNQIYGPYERECNSDGYLFRSKKYNVILTGLALTSKDVIKSFQKHFGEVENILNKFNGNGDDLTFNYIFRKYWDKMPIYVNGDYIELDTKGGYSFMRNHNDRRNEICIAISKI